MDVHDAHIKEWAEVLAKVEEMVRVYAVDSNMKIDTFKGNSLETLAKTGTDPSLSGKITYLPSGNKSADGNILRLRSKYPEVYRNVVSGKVRMPEALRGLGMGNARDNQGCVGRAQSAVRRMTPAQRKEFITWLRAEGYLRNI